MILQNTIGTLPSLTSLDVLSPPARQTLAFFSTVAEHFWLGAMHLPTERPLPQSFPGGLLRRLRQSDLKAFQAYRAIPEIGRFQGWSPMSEAEALEFLSEMNDALLFTPGAWVQLGIADSETDHLIGDIGLFLSEDGFTGRVGFTLDPSAQGRGIATSAVRQALRVPCHLSTAHGGRHRQPTTVDNPHRRCSAF